MDPRNPAVPLDRVNRSTSVLIDFATAREALNPAIYAKPHRDQTLTVETEQFLSCIVLHDQLYVDSMLVDSDKYGPDVVGVGAVMGLEVPKESRAAAFKESYLNRKDDPHMAKLPKRAFEAAALVDHGERRLIKDGLLRATKSSDGPHDPHTLTREEYSQMEHCSLDPVIRAQFYVQLSHELRMPIHLHPAKNEIIAQSFARAASDAMAAAFEASTTSPTEKVMRYLKSLRDSKPGDTLERDFDTTAETPSVAKLVSKTARLQKCSLFDAAHYVKDSTEAKDFRKWTSHLAQIFQGDAAERKEAEKMKNELRLVSQKWLNNTSEFVKHQTRKITLKHVPVVGQVLEFAGMSEHDIPDPILWQSRRFKQLLFINEILNSQ